MLLLNKFNGGWCLRMEADVGEDLTEVVQFAEVNGGEFTKQFVGNAVQEEHMESSLKMCLGRPGWEVVIRQES